MLNMVHLDTIPSSIGSWLLGLMKPYMWWFTISIEGDTILVTLHTVMFSVVFQVGFGK